MKNFRKNKRLLRFVSTFIITWWMFLLPAESHAGVPNIVQMSGGGGISANTAAGIAMMAAGVAGVQAAASSVSIPALIPIATAAGATASLAGMPFVAAAATGLAIGVGLVLGYQALKTLADSPDGSAYPSLKGAAGSNSGEFPRPASFPPTGSIVQDTNGDKHILGSLKYSGCTAGVQPGTWTESGFPVMCIVTSNGCFGVFHISPSSSGAPPVYAPAMTPKTDPQVKDGIAPGGVPSAPVVADIQNAIADGKLQPSIIVTENTDGSLSIVSGNGQSSGNSGITQYIDSSGNVRDVQNHEYVPVLGVVGSAISQVAATATNTAASTYQSAQAAAAGAAAAVSAAATAAAANPADTTLQNELEIAQAKLRAAQQAQAAAIEQYNSLIREAGVTAPVSVVSAIPVWSWEKLKELKGVLSNTFPFYLIPRIAGYYNIITALEPTAPSFELPMPGNNKIQINLSFFDPIAIICRWTGAVLISVASIFSVVGFYRGAKL